MAGNNQVNEHVYCTNISSNNSLSEHELDEIIEQYQEEENMQVEMSNEPKRGKRVREETDTEWQEQRKEKKMKEQDKIEMYISWNEELPKQFALAKLFKQEGITGITKVKYINNYRVRIEFNNNSSAFKLETCNAFVDKGWRFQRAMEKNYSYGVIKDVDMGISDTEILKSIICPNEVQLVSARRLNKRNNFKELNEGTWIPSGSVRLCFKGSSIPAYIYVDELRIRVDPYVFPVTQCTRCWKFGHTVKTCASKRIVCPKCGDNHSNCDIQTFKCINCNGSHMALTKTCSVFLKEKKIRELMAEFNCTYRRALSIYVPPSTSTAPIKKEKEPGDLTKSSIPSDQDITQPIFCSPPTFADIVKIKTNAIIHKEESPKCVAQFPKKPVKSKVSEFDFKAESPMNENPSFNPNCNDSKEEKRRDIHNCYQD